MTNQFNRRTFLKTASLSTLGLGVLGTTFPSPALSQSANPSSKINIAHIGLAGMQGGFHLSGSASQNRIALCDIDDNYLEAVGKENPDAKRYNDYREMLADLEDQIDAVIITTPDHTHAVAAIDAMNRGIHCYCEKPLAHDIYQIRLMKKVAQEKKIITQMGTQIHAGDNYRRVVELIQAGAIGCVKDIHVWVGTVWGGTPATNDEVECPKNIHWDLWIGPAPKRPYQPCYFGGNWRSFWDFGNGGMGDMACHFLDLPFWALNLQYPLSSEANALQPADKDFAARDLIAKFEFPALEGTEPLTLTWYDGIQKPPMLKEIGLEDKSNGVLFIGTEGMLYSNYGQHALLPKNKFEGFEYPPQTIPASIGHHAEWIKAIQDGKDETTCKFDYSGRVAETAILGPIAYRCGQKLIYDAENMKVTNCDAAAALIKQEYHNGWNL
ncbi:MAG: Gfo/Idh/MocA family oxidoreductase [Planctomycetia bacterium]|nr:Gfo/Idh/MocA family oxidoreductase [Planctomycetia bacterium]